MAVINTGKQMSTELAAIEEESRCIISSKYYTVYIKLSNNDIYEVLNKFSEICLCSDPQPNAVYFNKKRCLLIFSKKEDDIIYHNDIISKYITMFAKYNMEFLDNIRVSVSEFSTPLDIVNYIKNIQKQPGVVIRLIQRKNKITTETIDDFIDEKTISKYISFIFR